MKLNKEDYENIAVCLKATRNIIKGMDVAKEKRFKLDDIIRKVDVNSGKIKGFTVRTDYIYNEEVEAHTTREFNEFGRFYVFSKPLDENDEVKVVVRRSFNGKLEDIKEFKEHVSYDWLDTAREVVNEFINNLTKL